MRSAAASCSNRASRPCASAAAPCDGPRFRWGHRLATHHAFQAAGGSSVSNVATHRARGGDPRLQRCDEVDGVEAVPVPPQQLLPHRLSHCVSLTVSLTVSLVDRAHRARGGDPRLQRCDEVDGVEAVPVPPQQLLQRVRGGRALQQPGQHPLGLARAVGAVARTPAGAVTAVSAVAAFGRSLARFGSLLLAHAAGRGRLRTELVKLAGLSSDPNPRVFEEVRHSARALTRTAGRTYLAARVHHCGQGAHHPAPLVRRHGTVNSSFVFAGFWWLCRRLTRCLFRRYARPLRPSCLTHLAARLRSVECLSRLSGATPPTTTRCVGHPRSRHHPH
jgi:hypothetical protein